LIAVDTSVVVAAFATWHEAHADAVRVIAHRPDLPAPCALEVYAVLTRLPPPHRAEAAMVRDFLDRTFPSTPLLLPAEQSRQVIGALVEMGISGGATYDAVIAWIAVHHERELVTLDRRARPTYDRVGATVRLLG
jgi:predicted nucleic acid-binding protein